MERNVAADDFVNCVVRRGDYDVFYKYWLILVASCVPLLQGLAIGIYVIVRLNRMDAEISFGIDIIGLIVFLTAIMTEICIFSFLSAKIVDANRKHIVRDIAWADALCRYVDSRGGDSSVMRLRSVGYGKSVASVVSILSNVVWMITAAVLLGFEFFLLQCSDEYQVLNITFLLRGVFYPAVTLVIIQMIATAGSVLILPRRHDGDQAAFTEELSRQCAKFGLEAEPMRACVPKRKSIVHIVLSLVTLGIYVPIYFGKACKDMNAHLISQWEYEEYLLNRIIEFEGGIGVEDTTEGMKTGLRAILYKLARIRIATPASR